MPNMIMIAAAFAAGIWCADFWRWGTELLLILAAVFAGAACWQIRSGGRYISTVFIGMFFVVGIIRAEYAAVPDPSDIGNYAGKAAAVYGSVAELPQWADIDDNQVKIRYTVACRQIDAGEGVRPAGGSVLLTVIQPREARRAFFDDGIIVSGKIIALHNYQNPGRIDGAAALKLQGVSARMSARAETMTILPARQKSWQGAFAAWRQRMTDSITAAMAPDDAAILCGVLFGGYYGIKQQVTNDFASTGLVHILSVSGTHIALVAGMVFWLGGWLGLRREMAALPAAILIFLYSLLAGFNPPVVRSLIMGLTALAALGLGREKNSLQSLSIAALGMMAFQPGLLFDVGFGLSFGATAGLILFYDKLAKRLSFLPPRVAAATAVTLAAQLGTLPMIAWHFHSFPLSSFLANIIVLPLFEAIMALGLAGCLIAQFALIPGNLLLVACAQIIGAAVKITGLIAALPASSVNIPHAGLTGAFAYYLLLLWFFGYLPQRIMSPAAVFCRWPYRTGAISAAVVLLWLGCFYFPRPLQVHFIDVGQGDATLIITPHGNAALIDSGGSSEISDFDVGGRVVLPYLKHYNITKLDYLILTHGHKDHAGGAASIAASLPIRQIIVAKETPTSSICALAYSAKNRQLTTAYHGQTIILDGVKFYIEHAADFSKADRGNEVSNVVRISYGSHSFLITGDLGAQGENSMIAQGLASGDVLKVGHHGARTSTCADFIKIFAPKYAVISAGYANQFGHPHAETLARLSEQKITIYRTDRDGAVVFSSDGSALAVETFVKRQSGN